MLELEVRFVNKQTKETHVVVCLVVEQLAKAGGRNDHGNTKVVFKISNIVHPKLLVSHSENCVSTYNRHLMLQTRLSSVIAPSGQLPVATVAEVGLHYMYMPVYQMLN